MVGSRAVSKLSKPELFIEKAKFNFLIHSRTSHVHQGFEAYFLLKFYKWRRGWYLTCLQLLREASPSQNGWIFGKVPMGGGVISDTKIYVADFCHYKGYFGHEFRNKSATWFSENEGGGQRPFGTFPKIHPFWEGDASLIVNGKLKIAKKFECTWE